MQGGTMNCELCGKPAEIDFNALLPSFGLMVRGSVCLKCMSEAEDDMQVAVTLIQKRAPQRGIALPCDVDQLKKLADPVEKGAP